MHFTINKDWEIKNLLFEALGDENQRMFNLMEISMHTYIFVLDVQLEEMGKTFFIGGINTLLELIENNDLESFRVSLFSPKYENNGDYSISNLVKIEEGADTADQYGYVYYCADGKTYVDSPIANNKNELSNLKEIYVDKTK